MTSHSKDSVFKSMMKSYGGEWRCHTKRDVVLNCKNIKIYHKTRHQKISLSGQTSRTSSMIFKDIRLSEFPVIWRMVIVGFSERNAV